MKILINVIAVIVGLVVGSIVNMGLINLGPMIIPPPEGADITTYEGLQQTMHLFQPQNYIFPFLAHALGTLVGAFVASFIGRSHKNAIAYAIGGLFLIGGIMNATMLPSPMWFNIVDALFAYIPMAWIGYTLYTKIKK